MKHKNLLGFLASSLLFLACIPGLNGQNLKPISFKGLVDSLHTHGLSNAELADIVKSRGVDFELTADNESQLKNAGADATLLDTVRVAYRSSAQGEAVESAKPAAPSSSGATSSAGKAPSGRDPVQPTETAHLGLTSCVILKRMGPADQVTSRFYAFGIRGKQFQYVEGKMPEGVSFHGRLTDHDVRNLQTKGAEVLVLESHYTPDDLQHARQDCMGQAKPPAQVAANGSSSGAAKDTPPAPQPTAAPEQTKISVASNPAGADIEVDGSFVGNTPSTVDLPAGDHTITVKKNGCKTWERKLKTTGGSVSLNAELETETK